MKRALIGLALISTGCLSGRTSAIDVRPAFALSIGEGGGFSGQYSGYDLAPDGTVTRWRRMPVSGRRTPAGRLPRDARNNIWLALDGRNFFGIERREAGNYTRFLRVVVRADTHDVRWPRGQEARLDSLYDEIIALLSHP